MCIIPIADDLSADWLSLSNFEYALKALGILRKESMLVGISLSVP